MERQAQHPLPARRSTVVTYRVTVQTNYPDHRLPLGSRDAGLNCITVTADSLADAVTTASARAVGRVVCVEDITDPLDDYTDAQLAELLTTAGEDNAIDREDWSEMYAGKDLWMEDDFETGIVCPVAEALSVTACPGLTCSPVMNPDQTVDFMMVEVWNEATRTYRSTGVSSKNLRDYGTTGWEAVLSLARNLLGLVRTYHLA
jgi:hypothetical protein